MNSKTTKLLKPYLWIWLGLILPLVFIGWSVYLTISMSRGQADVARLVEVTSRLTALENSLREFEKSLTASHSQKSSQELLSEWQKLLATHRENSQKIESLTLENNLTEVQRYLNEIKTHVEKMDALYPKILQTRLETQERFRIEDQWRESWNHAIDKVKDALQFVRNRQRINSLILLQRFNQLKNIVIISCVVILLFFIVLVFYRRNVARRKLAEQDLRASEERFSKAFHFSPIPILILSMADERVIDINESFAQMTGYAREDVLGRFRYEFNFWDNEYDSEEFYKLQSRNGRIGSFEAQGIRKDGTKLTVILSSEVIEIEGKQCALLAFNDVTKRKETEAALRSSEERLQQSQKMEAIGRLAGGVAHDFNNILTAITGYSDLTLRRITRDDPLHRNIEEIKKAAIRAATLTSQLLAFSRKQVLQPKIINLNETVANMDQMLRRLIGEDINLLTVLDPKLRPVKADPVQIELALLNLAVNARDAMPKGGKMTIETKNVELDGEYVNEHFDVTSGQYVMLAVSDTGQGMDEETQSHIFEPFFTTKSKGKGTGLGLPTVYGIVKQSQGHVSFYSELDCGTTFKIYLPHVEDAVQPQETNNTRNLAYGWETILLVEDEEAVRHSTSEVLKMCGYNVIEAKDGLTALEICNQYKEPIHLVLTDVVMPRMNGSELAQRLSKILLHTKILFMSGYTDDSITHHGVLEEGINFIEKPFTPDALARKIREVLG